MSPPDETIIAMTCAWCHRRLDYVHGHAACVARDCPMFGLNQAECCGGETAAQCPVTTAQIAQRPEGNAAARRR